MNARTSNGLKPSSEMPSIEALSTSVSRSRLRDNGSTPTTDRLAASSTTVQTSLTSGEAALSEDEQETARRIGTRSWKYRASLSTSIDIASLDIAALSWAKIGESMKLVHSGHPKTPVELSMIGKVDGRNSELRPHAGYTRPDRFHSCLAAARLRLVVRAPRDEVKKRQFHQALQNLDCLLEKQRAPNIGWKADGVTFNELGDFYARDRRVVFQHRLFKVLGDRDSIDHKYTDKFYIWGTAGWPVRGECATKELKEMVNSKSHIVSALNIEGCYLFDIDSPEEYGQYFAGKDVIVRFTVSHTVDYHHKVDRFVTNIVSIRRIE